MNGAVVETSKAKIIRTLDSISVSITTVQPTDWPPSFDDLHHTAAAVVNVFIHNCPVLKKIPLF
jgi:hypothetical protein